MNEPLITIITPTYNRADLLPETVDSLLGQRFADFEYLIVDDGSSDDTAAVLARYRDPRLRVLCQDNQGEVAATNRGWSEARGRYVAIVSSDDPMHPLWLGAMVNALECRPEAVVAYPDWAILDGRGGVRRVVRTRHHARAVMIADFQAQPGPGCLIRKSAGDRLSPPRRPRFRYCADLDMWLRLSLLGPFVRVPRVLANWREHDGSISVAERTPRRAAELVTLARDFFAREDLPEELAGLARDGLASAHGLASWVVRDSDPSLAGDYLARATALGYDGRFHR
ncbi:glycosyltransferase [Billgrantia pellis]|nr:glycosyltransferase [Halomonas pellis]